MGNECSGPSLIEIRVTHLECQVMPDNDTLILEGPSLNYEKSGPVCITALMQSILGLWLTDSGWKPMPWTMIMRISATIVFVLAVQLILT